MRCYTKIGYYKYNIRSDMKDTLAKISSNIFNPFAVSIAVLVLLTVKAADGAGDILRLAFITIGISILPVLFIVFYLVRKKKLDSIFNNPREQRHTVYIVASLIGALDCALLWYFDVPRLLAVMFTAGFIAVIVFMAVNYFWKISLHTAFTAASAVVLIIVYGIGVWWTLLVLPLVGWSRLHLKQHNLLQIISGALLASVITFTVFWCFGYIG